MTLYPRLHARSGWARDRAVARLRSEGSAYARAWWLQRLTEADVAEAQAFVAVNGLRVCLAPSSHRWRDPLSLAPEETWAQACFRALMRARLHTPDASAWDGVTVALFDAARAGLPTPKVSAHAQPLFAEGDAEGSLTLPQALRASQASVAVWSAFQAWDQAGNLSNRTHQTALRAPLSRACWRGWPEEILGLLEAGCNGDTGDRPGVPVASNWTPLGILSELHHTPTHVPLARLTALIPALLAGGARWERLALGHTPVAWRAAFVAAGVPSVPPSWVDDALRRADTAMLDALWTHARASFDDPLEGRPWAWHWWHTALDHTQDQVIHHWLATHGLWTTEALVAQDAHGRTLLTYGADEWGNHPQQIDAALALSLRLGWLRAHLPSAAWHTPDAQGRWPQACWAAVEPKLSEGPWWASAAAEMLEDALATPTPAVSRRPRL